MKHIMKTQKSTITLGVLYGVTIAIVFSGVMTALLVFLIQTQATSGSIIPHLFVVRLISVLFGCLAGTKIHSEKNIIVIAAVMVTYFVLLVCMGIVFFEGTFQHMGNSLIATLSGGVVASIIQLKNQKRKVRGYKLKR